MANVKLRVLRDFWKEVADWVTGASSDKPTVQVDNFPSTQDVQLTGSIVQQTIRNEIISSETEFIFPIQEIFHPNLRINFRTRYSSSSIAVESGDFKVIVECWNIEDHDDIDRYGVFYDEYTFGNGIEKVGHVSSGDVPNNYAITPTTPIKIQGDYLKVIFQNDYIDASAVLSASIVQEA